VDDNPDQRLEDAEPITEAVVEAAPLPRKPEKGAYHQEIAVELVDDLALCIGQGLALIGRTEREPAEQVVNVIHRFVDAVLAGNRRLTSDPSDASLALACLYGQQLGRAFGWGFAHLRRAKKPGIVVVSPDRRHVVAPRDLLDAALAGAGGQLIFEQWTRIRDRDLPAAKPGTYLRL
jgi:hypothetical protein